MFFTFFASLIIVNGINGQSFNTGHNFGRSNNLEVPILRPEKSINPNVNEKSIADAVQSFAQDASISLWKKRILGNVVFSPLSIQTVLGLILLGTRGVTYQQLKKALFFKENVTDATIHETFQYILGHLETGSTSVDFDVSSILFVQKGIPISNTYKQISQALYDANVIDVDFRSQPSRATREVNRFVRMATRGKIPQILKSSVRPDTLMMAVNAISFNGPWQHPFNKTDTKYGIFDTGKERKRVKMMHNVIKIPFIKRTDLGFDMISLPYKNSHLSLYILTPTGNAGVSSLINLESGLSLISLDKLIDEMKLSLVDITIPKMKLQFRHNFKSHIQDLGATAIFNAQRANFGRMTTSPDFALMDVIHEAIIEISETGTVAAAATVTSINRLKSQTFAADKPSLLFVRDNSNGIILFWVRVLDP